MRLIRHWSITVLLVFWLHAASFAQSPVTQVKDSLNGQGVTDRDSISTAALADIDSIIALGKTFLYKPYRYIGPSPWQMDCSGYLKYIFSVYGYYLPHSSAAIANVVCEVDLKDVRKGDFLFFKGRNSSSNSIGHVAMVIEVSEDGSMLMMHSSVRNGIIIERYPSAYYYTPRFVKAGRLPSFELIH